MRLLLIILLSSVFVTPLAYTLDIQGEWQQGALLKGKVELGSQITFLNHSVIVDQQGEFIVGLGRDAEPEIILTVTDKSGQKKQHTYTVKQRDYAIQRIEGVEQKYVSPSKESLARIKNDGALVKKARNRADYLINNKADFKAGFIWPLIGPITGVYGSQRVFNGKPKRPHYGLDVAQPIGTVVVAPAAGVVTLAHKDLYYSGGTLILDHGQGLSSTFLHLSKLLVKENDVIKQGDPIAEVGATGRVTGAHLDWRMNWLDQRIDPQLLVPEMLEGGE